MASKSPPGRIGVIILAAGLGKRMRSALPKVLHEIGGQPLLFHVLDRVLEAAPDAAVAIVVGHGRERVEETVRKTDRYSAMDLTFVIQAEQKGTGHAARCAMDSEWGNQRVRASEPVLVLPGDLPLIPASLVREMSESLEKKDALRLLTCALPDPKGYGRVLRRGKAGPVTAIVEEKDASPAQRKIREVAASIYFFNPEYLQSGLRRLSNKNAQGEYYLTDLVAAAARAKKRVPVLAWASPEDLRGVNDPWELSLAARALNERLLRSWAERGVRFADPASTWVDARVELDEDVRVEPGVILSGETRIGRGATLGPRVVLRDVQVGSAANIKTGTVAEKSRIGSGAQVGPYAHLRPESEVGSNVKIGNFVELKKARVGEHSSIAHLSYVGDAEVGKNVNIGCGFVTCNFDGRVIDGQRKHRTIIEDDVFLGSDCQTVAPVRVGKGSYVASGSTITEDVEPESLAIARSRQVNKPGYAKKLRRDPVKE